MDNLKERLGLVLLGIIAIIAVIGLILLMSNATSGAVSYKSIGIIGPKPYIGTGGYNWDRDLVGFMPERGVASWCASTLKKDGGFQDVGQRQGIKDYSCFVIDRLSLPPRLWPYFDQVSYTYAAQRGIRVMACFASGMRTPPPEPIVCTPPAEVFPTRYIPRPVVYQT